MTPDEKRAGEHLKAIRRLLAAGKVLAARSRLTAAVDEGTTAGLWRLQRVLALPTVRRRLPAEPGGAADIEWFRRNAETYRGRWVAVAGASSSIPTSRSRGCGGSSENGHQGRSRCCTGSSGRARTAGRPPRRHRVSQPAGTLPETARTRTTNAAQAGAASLRQPDATRPREHGAAARRNGQGQPHMLLIEDADQIRSTRAVGYS